MWKWIKKLFTKQEPQKENNIHYLDLEDEKEIKELMLLEDDICGKHHG